MRDSEFCNMKYRGSHLKHYYYCWLNIRSNFECFNHFLNEKAQLNRKHTRYDKIKSIVCEKAAIYLNWPKTTVFQSFSNLPTKARCSYSNHLVVVFLIYNFNSYYNADIHFLLILWHPVAKLNNTFRKGGWGGGGGVSHIRSHKHK